MHFVPLTELLEGLTDKFIDQDCRRQCFEGFARSSATAAATIQTTEFDEGSGSDFCIKTISDKYSCADSNIFRWEECHYVCSSGLPTCIITKDHKRPCRKKSIFAL